MPIQAESSGFHFVALKFCSGIYFEALEESIVEITARPFVMSHTPRP